MNRATQNVLLLLLAVSAGLMTMKGAYLHYVKPSLLPWLIFAAAGLGALALVCIVRDIRSGGVEVDDGHHQHRGAIVWLLLVPIVLTAFVIPPAIEATGAAPVSADQSHKRAFPPLPAGRAPVVSLPEVMMRAATDSAGTLTGRLITVTGFTLPVADGRSDEPRSVADGRSDEPRSVADGRSDEPRSVADLGRVVIVCCAADAQLARLHLAGPAAGIVAGYPTDTWVEIEGRVVQGSSTAASSFVPTMTVETATTIDRPANTYTY